MIITNSPLAGNEEVLCSDCRRGRSDSGKPINTTNLQSTCYVDSSLQMLYHLGNVRDDVIASGFPCNDLEDSGRNAVEWLPKTIGTLVGMSEQEISKASAIHMQRSKRLASQMTFLFKLLANPRTGHVNRAQMASFFSALEAYNPKWKRNEPDDAAELLSDLLDCLALVSDTSTPNPPTRRVIQALDAERDANPGRQAPLQDESVARFLAYCNDGHLSRLSALTAIQEVVEWKCTDRECDAIGRNFFHHKALQLLLPRREGASSGVHFTLRELLQAWAVEKIDIQCPFAGDAHPGEGNTRYHCLTRTPKILLMHLGKPRSSEQTQTARVWLL